MPMRELTSHQTNNLNRAITITVEDEPGPGGACCEYLMTLDRGADGSCRGALKIQFQKGSPHEAFNGFTNEALLAIVEDRMKGFQSGPFACRENALALTHLQEAIHWLNHRTFERQFRGVEGTLQK